MEHLFGPYNAKDHHNTSHIQGMEAPYIGVGEYEAQTHGKQSTLIVKAFTCDVRGPSKL